MYFFGLLSHLWGHSRRFVFGLLVAHALYLPAFLRSTGLTLLLRYYVRSDFCFGRFFGFLAALSRSA
jgi:hypothetical protein